nr:hypothetical protein Iba_chr02bCG8460 [Ipomoea batatas]
MPATFQSGEATLPLRPPQSFYPPSPCKLVMHGSCQPQSSYAQKRMGVGGVIRVGFPLSRAEVRQFFEQQYKGITTDNSAHLLGDRRDPAPGSRGRDNNVWAVTGLEPLTSSLHHNKFGLLSARPQYVDVMSAKGSLKSGLWLYLILWLGSVAPVYCGLGLGSWSTVSGGTMASGRLCSSYERGVVVREFLRQ